MIDPMDHIGLVWTTLQRYKDLHLGVWGPFEYAPPEHNEDLFQEGFMALMRACEGFDPDRGYEFSTYACRAIMNQYINMNERATRRRRRARIELRDPKATEAYSTANDGLRGVDTRDFLAIAMELMDDTRADVVSMSHGRGYTMEQTARVIGRTRQRVHQILSTLPDWYAQLCGQAESVKKSRRGQCKADKVFRPGSMALQIEEWLLEVLEDGPISAPLIRDLVYDTEYAWSHVVNVSSQSTRVVSVSRGVWARKEHAGCTDATSTGAAT